MLSGTHLGRAVKLLFSIGIPLLLLAAVWKMTGICFETNDDVIITKILSGTMAGKPDSHAIFLNCLLSCPIYLLYCIAPNIPWYGGLLVLCHILSYAALLQSIWSGAKRIWEYALFGGLIGCFALGNLYLAASIQFTSTAALLAIAGYGCLFLHQDFKRGLLLFFGLELLAFCIRSHAMLMIQLMGGAVGVALYMVCEGGWVRERCKKTACMILAVLAVLAVGSVGSLSGYRGKEWDAYRRFTAARAELFDYYGASGYEEVKFILDKHGVTKAEYDAFCSYVILDGSVSAECIEELVLHASGSKSKPLDIMELLKEVWDSNVLPGNLRIDKTVSAAWMVVLLWLLLQNRFCLLLPLGGLAIGKTLVRGYLYWKGRLPFRVTAPLLVCEILLLVSLLVWDYIRNRTVKQVPYIFGLSCAVFAIFCLHSAKMQYRAAVKANVWQEAFLESLVAVQDYCRERPQNRYILDAWSFSYYKGSVFRTDIYGGVNYIESGSWFSGSPVLRQRIEDYLNPYENDFYYIVIEGDGYNRAEAYFVEKTGRQPELIERIAVSHGGAYLVWHFGR